MVPFLTKNFSIYKNTVRYDYIIIFYYIRFRFWQRTSASTMHQIQNQFVSLVLSISQVLVLCTEEQMHCLWVFLCSYLPLIDAYSLEYVTDFWSQSSFRCWMTSMAAFHHFSSRFLTRCSDTYSDRPISNCLGICNFMSIVYLLYRSSKDEPPSTKGCVEYCRTL